ncbi:YcaO-like family protein [Candidatus Giovannonibacteria bacterium]|nr:YcaO-like family protein [Candidatus Giovannonibacteria bacterium]
MENKHKSHESTVELGPVTRARQWISGLLDGGLSTTEKIIAKISILFLEFLEEIFGQSFYVKSKFENDFFTLPNSKIANLAASLKKDGFIKSLNIRRTFPDEPRAILAWADFGELILKSDTSASRYAEVNFLGGVDFKNTDKAALRCLGEAVERTCLGFYKKKDLVFGTFKELKNKAIDPKEFVAFSKEQLASEKFRHCRFDDQTRFGWVWGRSLISGKEILVPAQLAYVPYKYEKGEPVIRNTISTGAAAYTDYYETIYRATCEVIERDAFIIHYLNKLAPPVLDLENFHDKELQEINAKFKRYNLELYVLDVTTDIPAPTYVSLIIDRTGVGPAVTVSNKTDLNIKKAIKGSIEGCLRIYSGYRWKMEKLLDVNKIPEKWEQIESLSDRCFFWGQAKMLPEIEFFIKGPKKMINAELLDLGSRERLDLVLEYFKKNNMEVIAVDLTIPEARKNGFYVSKVLIPKLQPLHLSERHRYFGGERLYQLPIKLNYLKQPLREEELNQIPQPFA